MTKIYVDAGTSWSKVLEIYENEEQLVKSPLTQIENLESYVYTEKSRIFTDKNTTQARTFLFPSKLFGNIDVSFEGATGHMVKKRVKPQGKYENELMALAYGSKKILSEEELKDATVVDLGSRDIKWVKFKNNKYKELDWNGNCGSVTGATVEMLCKFYNIDPCLIAPQKEKIPVVCGVFAMEKIMDDISADIPADIAIAKYIHGIAYNTWNFARKPNKIYLSGGFCMNKCFIESLKFYCEVVPIGRFLLLEGLY